MPDEGAHTHPTPPPGHTPPGAQPAHDGEHHQRHRAKPRGLVTFGVVVLLGAAAAAAYGIVTRNQAEATLEQWTEAQAVPTVSAAPPDRSGAAQHLSLPGDVQAFYEAPIYARVSGYLKMWAQDIGARVHKGELLAVIETPDLDQELAQAEADLATAKARANLADVTYQRWHALVKSNSVSIQSADEKQGDALAARATVAAQLAHVSQLRALEGFKRLVAPFDGVVTTRNTDVGALINSGASAPAPLFKVADMHEMRVYVRVPQSYASQLKVGMQATLSEPQYPGETFPAILATTSQSVAAESRTVLVELMAPNPDGKLWAGTYAEVNFVLPAAANTLRVPSSALIFRSHGAQLATVQGGRIVMKRVTIGRNLGEEIEIESGIGPDDQVVTTPLDTIEDGETVNVAARAVAGTAASPAPAE